MGIVQGRGVDASLNETGRKQADKFFQNYRHVNFDWVYTSCLRRSRESVERFIAGGIGHTPLEGLDEIHWGSKEGKPFTESDHLYYQEVTDGWRQGKTDLCIAGGESPEQVQNRQKEALGQIMKHRQQQTILICMHGRALRIFMCLLLNYPLRSMDMFNHDNTGLYRITFTGTLFRVDEANSLSHLNGEGSISQF